MTRISPRHLTVTCKSAPLTASPDRSPGALRLRPDGILLPDSRVLVASDVAPFFVIDPDQPEEFPSAPSLAYDLIELIAVAAIVAGVCLIAYAFTGSA